VHPTPSTLRELWLDLLALLWPCQCIICETPDRQLCEACAQNLRSEREHTQWVMLPFEGSACVSGPYAGPLRALLIAYKHAGLTSLGRTLGAQLRAPLREALANARTPMPLVVTVPSRAAKTRERGYRHVDLLVRVALRETRGQSSHSDQSDHDSQSEHNDQSTHSTLNHARLVPGALRALPGRTGQVGLDHAARIANAARVAVPRRMRNRLVGREVVLVDDIITTGATVTAAARALESIGARVVAVAAVCATERRDAKTQT